MKPDELVAKIKSYIGEGKLFSTESDAARKLGLSTSKATKLFDFLDGKDTRYMVVLDWIEQLGGRILFPDQEMPGSSEDGATRAEVLRLKKELAEAKNKISGLKGQLVGMERTLDKLVGARPYDPGRPLRRIFDPEDREDACEDDSDYGMVQEEPGTYGITNGDDSFGNDKGERGR